MAFPGGRDRMRPMCGKICAKLLRSQCAEHGRSYRIVVFPVGTGTADNSTTLGNRFRLIAEVLAVGIRGAPDEEEVLRHAVIV